MEISPGFLSDSDGFEGVKSQGQLGALCILLGDHLGMGLSALKGIFCNDKVWTKSKEVPDESSEGVGDAL